MPEQEIFVFSPNSMNEIQSCGRKFEFSHIKGFTTMEKATPLDRGSMMHDMLAIYRILLKCSWSRDLTNREIDELKKYEVHPGVYKFKDIVEICVMVGRRYMADSDLDIADGEEVINNLIEYFDFYQNDGWQPIEVEGQFSRVLYESRELILVLEGYIDLITDSRAGRTVVDSKSSARRQEPNFLSNQFIGYAWAVDVPSVTVDKVGFQKTLKAKERFNRYILSYPADLKEEWRNWAIYWGKLAVHYIKEGLYPPNFTSCDKYGGCIYQPICRTSPGAREWKASTLFRVDGERKWLSEAEKANGHGSSKSPSESGTQVSPTESDVVAGKV